MVTPRLPRAPPLPFLRAAEGVPCVSTAFHLPAPCPCHAPRPLGFEDTEALMKTALAITAAPVRPPVTVMSRNHCMMIGSHLPPPPTYLTCVARAVVRRVSPASVPSSSSS